MKTQNDSLLCIEKQKENPWPIVSNSPPPLPLPLTLSVFVAAKIAIVIWAKISITASMPCHKRNPIPETQGEAARQALWPAWESDTVPSLYAPCFVIESNHLWLPNASEIMKRKPLCRHRHVRSRSLPGRQFCGSHKTNQANNLRKLNFYEYE